MKGESYDENRNVFHELLGLALTDERYRQRLIGSHDDKAQVLKELGVDPTDEHLRALDEAVGAIDKLAGHFGIQKAAT